MQSCLLKKEKITIARTVFDVDGSHVLELESWIDEYDSELPKLTKFILPVS